MGLYWSLDKIFSLGLLILRWCLAAWSGANFVMGDGKQTNPEKLAGRCIVHNPAEFGT